MPTYEYACTACGNAWEVEQRISESALDTCPKCNEKTAKRQISGGGAFILKGGGWYSDLYSSSGAKKTESSSSSSTTTAAPSSTTSSAPSTAPAAPSTPAPSSSSGSLPFASWAVVRRGTPGLRPVATWTPSTLVVDRERKEEEA